MTLPARETPEDKPVDETDQREASLGFRQGLRKGIPIALGYIPVAFTFGLMAASSGISTLIATVISLTNLTSAGQFAGTNLIIAGAPLLEIAATTFVINIRYLLMSLSLSQKIVTKTSLSKRAIVSFGITDEVFAVASLESGDLPFSYMLGLIFYPYFGWAIGTALGALICSALPETLHNAMGIALYGMFIALVVPSAKKSGAVLAVTIIAVALSSALTWTPCLNAVSPGWRITIATVIACIIGALVFPRKDALDG